MVKHAVAYLRVSTDETRQDPERQRTAIDAWCENENVDLVDTVSEEASSKKQPNPLDREGFRDAIEAATELEADAIVVEDRDRFSRDEARRVVYYQVLLEEQHGLDLWVASRPLDAQDKLVGSILDTAESAMAHRENEERSRRVSEGMQRAKENGKNIGRRPELSPQEVQQAREMYEPGEVGYRSVAHELSKQRGAFDVADTQRQEELRVSHMTVKRAVKGNGPYATVSNR